MPSSTAIKEFFERYYWKQQASKNQDLKHDHYVYFFTEYFDLSADFYSQKRILDIGCGPRGSLEWASMTKQRVGLDPLADYYHQLRSIPLNMELISGYSEDMPFPSDHFDVVAAFNALDHVEDLTKTCREIERVIKPGGLFLFIVDIHFLPTLTEPQCLNWNFIEDYFPGRVTLFSQRLKRKNPFKIYTNIKAQIPIRGRRFQNGILTGKIQF